MTHFDYPNNQSDSNIIPNLKRVCKILIPPESRNLKIGGAFWLKSEPFLKKIRTLISDCRPAGDNPARRFRPPPLRFGEQNRKIFLTFFNCLPPKFFSIKETKIFLFCLPADAGIAETLSRAQPAFADEPRPETYCVPLFFWFDSHKLSADDFSLKSS
ncbi:hypothetical protein KKA96_03885 [Patescibacteria group bacterium]|nr:hypothetical protein [Patescibacteria group bacterium]